MSINRITRLRDCGVFRDFTWPNCLPDFARYNLIYGWNGSGKTTLSKILRALEVRTAPPNGQVTLMVGGRNVGNDDFAQVTLPVRVFNRDFVAENVFPAEGAVAPIFVLGKQNVEKQKQVEQLKATLTVEQIKLDSNRKDNTTTASALDKFCIDRAGVIKDKLRSPGSNPYNYYDKGDFSRRAEAMVSAGDRDAHTLDDATRNNLLVQLSANPKPKLQPLTYRLPSLKPLAESVADLLSATVVSAAIQSLKDDATLSSWVHTGLELYQERHSVKCLFCDQPMPKDRLAALEAHFNTEYEGLVRKLDEQIASIQADIKTATDLSLPIAAQLYDDLSFEYERTAAVLRGECNSGKRVLEVWVKALEDKKRQPFERVALDVVVPALNDGAVDLLNNIILKHNQVCDGFKSHIDTARRSLEADSVAANLDQYVKLKGDVEAAEAAVAKADGECKRLTEDIEKLEREIVEHREPADQLNEDLRSYLGHGELRLEVKNSDKDPGYLIMRHDVPAEALSEGEITAIALLYFLKSLQDRRFGLTNGVVVLDDPVSSLDANSPYSAFGLIQARTKQAAQLFILTHNFTFFRQVHNWFYFLNQDKRNKHRLAHFYMLECVYEQDRRCASISRLDRLLKDFESEYHYLFAYIYRAAIAAPQLNLGQNYVLPNLARRLLETFLAFRQPQMSGKLRQKLRVVKFDEAKKIRILRFLHTHSHGSALGEPEHDLSLLSEAKGILKDLLNLMQSQDADHFAAMASLVTASDTEDSELNTTPESGS